MKSNSFNLPSKKEVIKELRNYKLINSESNDELLKVNGKVYEDPEYSQAETKSLVNYSAFSGEGWELCSYNQDNVWNLEITNATLKKSTDKFTISFPNYDEMISFINNIYPQYPVEQLKNGINIKNIINNKALIKKITVAGVGLSFLYLLFRKTTKNDR